jgi:hypothetical protein
VGFDQIGEGEVNVVISGESVTADGAQAFGGYA